MIRTRSLALSLVALLVASIVLPGVAVADVRGEPEITVHAADTNVEPGTESNLSVTLLNEGNVYRSSVANRELESKVTTARGVRVEMESGSAPISVETGTQVVGTLPEGSSPPVPFRIEVDEDAKPGTYEVPVEVRYTYTRFIGTDQGPGVSGLQYEEGEWERYTITITVEERARFDVVDVTPAVAVGESGTVSLDVRNVGTELARDARLTLESTNSDLTFGSSETASTHVDAWEPGETRRLQYRTTVAPEAVVRSYAVTGTVQYEDTNGIERTARPITFGITPGPEQSFAVTAVESTLRVGEEGVLRGELVNNGTSTVRNAVLRLEAESSTVNPTETEFAVGTLGPGERVPFSFDVELSDSADAGPRQFTYHVRYRGPDGSRIESDPIDVRVTARPSTPAFEVDLVTTDVEAGSSGPLTFAVTNNGSEVYTDVRAKVFTDDPLSTSDSEAFIDRLEPGETANVTFVVGVGGSAIAKTYPATIDFQYDDADGDTLLSDSYRAPVTVTRPSGEGGIPAWVLGLGSVFTIALVLVWVRRRE